MPQTPSFDTDSAILEECVGIITVHKRTYQGQSMLRIQADTDGIQRSEVFPLNAPNPPPKVAETAPANWLRLTSAVLVWMFYQKQLGMRCDKVWTLSTDAAPTFTCIHRAGHIDDCVFIVIDDAGQEWINRACGVLFGGCDRETLTLHTHRDLDSPRELWPGHWPVSDGSRAMGDGGNPS